MLRIPLTAARGKGKIRELRPLLVVIQTFKGVYLARPTDSKSKGVDQLRILFKIVPSVTHKPHPDEILDQTKLGAAAREGMLKAAAILTRASSGGGHRRGRQTPLHNGAHFFS